MFRITPLTERALCLLFEAHKGQKDKCDVPYVFHPYNVAARCAHFFNANYVELDIDYETLICVALLHDVVEDTSRTLEQVSSGFKHKKDFVKSLDLITRKENQTREEYLDEILNAEPVYPLIVKLMDLKENMRRDRITTDFAKQVARNRIYAQMYAKVVRELIHRYPSIVID